MLKGSAAEFQSSVWDFDVSALVGGNPVRFLLCVVCSPSEGSSASRCPLVPA